MAILSCDELISALKSNTRVASPNLQLRAAGVLTEFALRKPPESPYTLALWELIRELNPISPESYDGIGTFAQRNAKFKLAAENYEKAMALRPSALGYLCLSVDYDQLGNITKAIEWIEKCIDFDPKFSIAYGHLYTLHDQLGDLKTAREVIQRGLAACGPMPEILFALAELDLKEDNYAAGWPNYEFRDTRRSLAAQLDEFEEWTGQPISGKTLLVMRDQGMGDEIMFARYLWALKETGAQIWLFTYPELARLMAGNFPFVSVVTDEADFPKFDYWVACGSLALRASELNPSVGSKLDCLKPFSVTGESRAAEVVRPSPNLKVALCWKGNKAHARDRLRSIAWDDLKPLLETAGCDFYSLQIGGEESGIPNIPAHAFDVADTAAAIVKLDLVIAVDTMVAHLAASMGKPTWLILPDVNDWRWRTEGCSTDWYPSMTIFRRDAPCVDPVDADGIGDSGNEWIARRLSIELNPRAKAARAWRGPVWADRDRACGDLVRVGNTKSGTTRYGRMEWLANDRYIGCSLDLYGEYSQSEVDLIAKLGLNLMAIDVGANVGALTLPIADQFALTYAFEPQREYFDVLCRNIGARDDVAYIHMALGDECGSVELERIDTQRAFAPGRGDRILNHSVACATIDSFGFANVDFIKIDTDGSEMAVLRGAKDTIMRCRPVLYVEFDRPEQYPDMLPWLDAHGYRIYMHNARLFNPQNFAKNHVNVFGNLVSKMLLCIPQERKDRPGEWGIDGISRVKVTRT